MDVAKSRRVLTRSLLVLLQFCALNHAYEIPEVTLQAFTPKGFRVSIPDAPKISLFVFQGNINQAIDKNDVGTLSGEVLKSTNGRWVYEDRDFQLKVGDVINYLVFVSLNSAGYIKDKQSFTVTALEEWSAVPPAQPTAPPQPSTCQPSLTRIRGGSACAGQTIFEDNFETLREDVWQIKHYIPVNHPEYPFVSYQRLATDPTVSVVNGNLRISPKLQQTQTGYTSESIYSGVLDLRAGCTGIFRECYLQASGAYILPPVVSGRITSKNFAFTYGTVHIRAKLPQGDWLYPEILLEPFVKKYGELKYASGVLKIAVARGNRELRAGISDFSNRNFYGGPIMDFDCRNTLIDNKKLFNGKMWGDDFHVYSLNWTPDRISLLIDSEEWAYIEAPADGLSQQFLTSCPNIPSHLLATGTKIAPFDDHFYITLGVAAGGITEFNDDVITTGNARKPWRNQGSKASLNFWQAMDSWYSTWNNPELLVDYVKVVAL